MNHHQKQSIYIASNAAMPYIFKIGFCTGSVNKRMKQLSNSSVPFPFFCEFNAEVEDASHAEAVIHQVLKPYRLAANREFFALDINTAIDLIKLICKKKKPSKELPSSSQITQDSITSNEAYSDSFIKPNSNIQKVEVLDDNTLLHKGSLYSFQGFINHLKSLGENIDDWLVGNKKLSEFIN